MNTEADNGSDGSLFVNRIRNMQWPWCTKSKMSVKNIVYLFLNWICFLKILSTNKTTERQTPVIFTYSTVIYLAVMK